jgi:hypothetical protein
VSTLSILVGTTDHVFFSPILLTTFSMDGALEEANGLFTIPGRFVDPDRLDLLAVGGNDPKPSDETSEFDYTLWILPDFGSGNSLPTRLPWDFPPEFQPVALDPEGTRAPLAASFTAGDLDADGLDELVVAGPIGESRCLLSFAGVQPDATRLDSLSAIVLDEGCDLEPVLRVRDLDGDGAVDIALLVGRREEGTSAVQVLWNLGFGAFSPDASTRIHDPEGIRSFTPFQLAGNAAVELAYATPRSVTLVGTNRAERSFSTGTTLTVPDLMDVTSIVAGDVNGDGLDDLAVADQGAVRVLRARLSQ